MPAIPFSQNQSNSTAILEYCWNSIMLQGLLLWHWDYQVDVHSNIGAPGQSCCTLCCTCSIREWCIQSVKQ